MLTVSPLFQNETARKLQVIWYVDDILPNDIIRLYNRPNFYKAVPLFEVIPTTSYGWSVTNVAETFIKVELRFKHVCLGYYVAYWRKRKVLFSSCLQSNPTWMRDYRRFFGGQSLFDMFIPGTHDSSAYHAVYQSEDAKESRLEMYVYTQEESILEQLVHGARYLDLRVGRAGDVYYAHHGIARLYPFEEVLEHIDTFLKATKEILILDFHDFPVGFASEGDHLKFVDYLHQRLGQYMLPSKLGWGVKLKKVWSTGKSLIISYNNEKVVQDKKDMIWPPITQMWGNVQNVTGLYDYLTQVFESPPEGLWSAQAELTAKLSNIAKNDLGGLRKMASSTNTQVTKWFRGEWGTKCHIIAMDFIRASAIVDVAIEMNLRRSYRRKCPKKGKKKTFFFF